jgi:hypothetical protein
MGRRAWPAVACGDLFIFASIKKLMSVAFTYIYIMIFGCVIWHDLYSGFEVVWYVCVWYGVTGETRRQDPGQDTRRMCLSS